MDFTLTHLKHRPYIRYYLLNDFIHRKSFTVNHSGESLVFDYLGDSTKFFTPSSFSSYHDVIEALSWLNNANVHLKHDKNVYQINALQFPNDYEEGYLGDIQHAITGLAILAKVRNPDKTIAKQDIIAEISNISVRNKKNSIKLDKNKNLELTVKLSDHSIEVITSPLFIPTLNEQFRKACSIVNTNQVHKNFNSLNNKLQLYIGGNRGVTTTDVKLYESVNGNAKEIRLDKH